MASCHACYAVECYGKEMTLDRTTLTHILELARWAPSGDNTQPWRFEVVSTTHVRVYGHDTRDHVLYDFQGHPSHIAHGALMETLRIAASGFGLACDWQITSSGDHRTPVYDVRFTANPGVVKSPLFDCIERRTVQRRPMKTLPLTLRQRAALSDAAGNTVSLQFFETWNARVKMAAILWKSARIRLTCKEAYPVHKAIIEWRVKYSKDRIPEPAVGVDPATARLMEWVMQSWERVHFFNRFLGGTIAPRIQLDLLPALFCAAHLLVRPSRKPQELEDWVKLGAIWQRIWLTATYHGLHIQPEMTPVIFRWYARTGRRFSSQPVLFDQALALSDDFEKLAGTSANDPFGFLLRVGSCKPPVSRSIRMDLQSLGK